jgi:hypothetical protein
MTIQKDESKLWTTSEMVRQVSVSVEKMSPKQKAKLRMYLRRAYNMSAKPEPALWKN